MELELDIFFNTEESETFYAAGMEVTESMLDVKKVTFYSIGCIETNMFNGKSYTTINSCGKLYVCPFPYRHVKKLIKESLNT